MSKFFCKTVRVANFQTKKYAASHCLCVNVETGTCKSNILIWPKDKNGDITSSCFFRSSNNYCKMHGYPMKRAVNMKKTKTKYNLEEILNAE